MVKLGVNVDHVATLRQARGVDLSGAAVAPPMVIKPRRLGLGRVIVGATTTAAVMILNQTAVDMNVSKISSNSPEFTPALGCIGVLPHGGGNCQIVITFKPAKAGARRAVLTINDNAAHRPQKVRLLGTGALH